jgi:hypothetical protein
MDLTREYDAQGRRASGQWEKDLESKIERTTTGYRVQILGSYYSYWMEYGRNPSAKFPPIDAIRQWIDDKGIIAEGISKNSLAFLIARKIAREGYKGKSVISSVLTDAWCQQLIKNVGLFMSQNIKEEILREFKAA